MQDREIIVSPMPFNSPKVVAVAHGSTICDIVNQLYPDTYVIVEIDGVPIPRDRWHLVPPVDSHVLISVPLHGGGGGKNPLRTILTIVVAAAAIVVSKGALAPYLGSAFAAGETGALVAGYGVLTAGTLLVNAIAPIKYSGPGLAARQTYEDSPTYSIGANTNMENPWGVIPAILGTHKVFPPLGAKSYTELVGSDEYLRMLVVWGYGPMKIADLKLGDTLLSSYTDVEVETREGWSTDTPLTLFPSAVQQDSIGVILTSAGGQIKRTAKTNVDELSVDISFPRGLVEYDNAGNRVARSVTVLVQYREVGTTTWIDIESKTFSNLTTSAIRYGWRWKVNNTKQYEIGITRISPDTSADTIIDEVYWTYLRSIETTYPITFPHPLAVTALRIKATDQLSGNIDNLNGVVSSYCPVWNSVTKTWGSTEADYAVTNNPAALIRHVLTGKANARERALTQVDNDTLGEFYEFCATNGYAFNMYRDYVASVFETCQDIASAARGSITIKDGLWSVIADTGNQTLVQHITPRNSWGFSAEKRLYDHPHAFRIKFKNELNDWNDDERIVYDDGYTSATATLFESIEFPGITHPNLIWKFGRFHIAQARLRPEMYSLYMDFEHLVCRRGNKVRVSHDVPLWGSGWGRIKSLTLDGGNITHITLDELVTMEAGKSYACRFRLADGGTPVLSIVTVAGETDTLELATTVAVALGPKVGDLAMFGESEKETVELLVHSITRASDFTAQLFLVDVASAIYNADAGEIPPFDPQTSTPVDITTLAPEPPTIDGIDTGTDVSAISGGGSVSTILVYLSAPPNTVRIRGYRVRYRLIGETQWQYTGEMSTLTIPISPVSDQQSYEIQAQSISVYGVESQWTTTETGASDLPLITPPPATNITVQATAIGPYYDYGAILITFTPPGGNVYSYSEIYASTNDITYYYVGRDGTGSFTFSGLGAVYELGDTCYIKLRSVSHFGVRASLPIVPDASILIQGTIKLAGFYAGAQFFGDAENPNNAKILLDKANTLIRLGDLSAPNLIMDGDYSGVPAVRSSNYVSGAFGAGFLLKPDLLEVGNIAARGILRASVFEYNSVSVHSGSDVTIKGGDVLAEDMTSADESIITRITEAGDVRITEGGDIRMLSGIAELTIEGNDTFEVGDILRIKEGTDDEWLMINTIVNATTYGVVRDLAGSYAADSKPAWTKGASVSNYGKSGDGGIYITASDTNAPNLSVFTHGGSPWNDIITHLRLGNLNGYAGYGSDIYGLAAYINANNFIKIDPVNGIRMTGSIVITSGSGIGNLSDAGPLATQSSVDWQTQVAGTGKPEDNADVTDYVAISIDAQAKADAAEEAAKDYADANFVTQALYGVDIAHLQSQIDGNITTWFYDGEPDLSSIPSVDWTTTELKNQHLGDIYYDNLTGYSYRFNLTGGSTYAWVRITDSDITEALAQASEAQDTADAKRRVFVVQPTPPYDVGDLWTEGAGGDLKRCATARQTGVYYAPDWEIATKYTDDTRAVEAEAAAIAHADAQDELYETIAEAYADGIVSDEEARAIADAQAKADAAEAAAKLYTEGWSEAGATKNIIYRQPTAPTGANGDLWYDTDAPLKPLYRHNGTTWEEIGNYASNTNQLTDGAGLGQTALWASVTGTGKPEDNADVTAEHTAAAIAGQGALATRNTVNSTTIDAGSITLEKCAAETTARLFSDDTAKANIEAWRKAGSPTYLDGTYIFAQSITADKFISTLYGDMNQAMSYVKTVLGAGDEYEHDLTATDLAAGIHSDIDALTHADYGLSIRLATAKRWDDVGAKWDTGTWDEPTKASGSWTSASMDLGSLKTLQMALRYTLVEENPASTTPTIKGIYSTDGTSWGTNDALNDGVWETMSMLNITGAIYKASGSLKSFRYFKIKVELSTTVTTDRIILHTMTYLGNVINLFGFEANKAIAEEGTTINISGFTTTPAITVTPVGATPLVPLITAQSASSVTVKLFNLSGVAVSGNANITIIGA